MTIFAGCIPSLALTWQHGGWAFRRVVRKSETRRRKGEDMPRTSQGVVRRLSGHTLGLLVVIGLLVVSAANRLRARDSDRDPLPARALARIGTYDLRTRDYINQLAFSPDGRLIAAAEHWNSTSNVSLFDVKTGRQARRLVVPDQPGLYCDRLVFSPNGTILAWWASQNNRSAMRLWDLAADRLLYREELNERSANTAAFSPDGRLIALGYEDGIVRVRSVKALAAADVRARPGGEPAPDPPGRDLVEAGTKIHSLMFTPDGTRLVVGASADVWASISAWRLADGLRLWKIDRAHGPRETTSNLNPSCLAVTPDGRRVLSTGLEDAPDDRKPVDRHMGKPARAEIRSWDLATGARDGIDLRDDAASVSAHAALSPDGRHIVLSGGGSVRVLDAVTGRTDRTINLPRLAALSPDGSIVAVSSSNTIYLYDVGTGRRLVQDDATPALGIERAAWSPAGDRIVTAHGDGIVRVWDAATGRLTWHRALAAEAKAPEGGSEVSFLAFPSDGHRVIATGFGYERDRKHHGIVAIYDAATGALVRGARDEGHGELTLSPDGRNLFGIGAERDTHAMTLEAIETDTGRELWRTVVMEWKDYVGQSVAVDRAVAYRADSDVVELAMLKGEVIHYDGRTGRQRRRVRLEGPAVGGEPARRDWVSMMTVAFRLDGRLLVSVQHGGIGVWDVESGKLRHWIRPPAGYGSRVCIAPDGRTLAVISGSAGQEAILLYDLDSGKEVLVLQPRDEGTRLLEFSPDGTKLFTGFDRGSGIIWDVRRGEIGIGAK
jgi:WD40 repeat protein